MPSHKPMNDRKPRNERSLTAFAEDTSASGSKATEARTKDRFIEALPFN
jgi:hypothetical protein